MIGGVFLISIQAQPESVWPWIAELERHAQWSPKPYRMEWVSGEPNAIGSRFRSVGWIPNDKDHVNEGEITASEPPRRFALRADDTDGAYENTYLLAPTVDDGTEVSYTLTFPPMQGLKAFAISILFALIGKRQTRRRMRMLKAKAEGSV